MNYGGDAADQIVRYSLDGVDLAQRDNDAEQTGEIRRAVQLRSFDQAFGYAGKASGGICCRRIKRPEENEGQDQNGADVKGEQAIEVLHCAI